MESVGLGGRFESVGLEDCVESVGHRGSLESVGLGGGFESVGLGDGIVVREAWLLVVLTGKGRGLVAVRVRPLRR